MVELTEAEIAAATERGRQAFATVPRAKVARYDRMLDRIVVELTNGCTFAFPPRLAQGLEQATPEQLAEVEILGQGFGLHWEALDADLTVEGLMAGRFGSEAYMEHRFDRSHAAE